MKLVDDNGKTLCEIEWGDSKLATGNFYTDEYGTFKVIIEESK